MTSLSKTTGARNGLWAEKGGPFCLLIVFLHGSACSTLLLSVRSMLKTNCCVPYCHASSTRHTRLSWHRLPKDKEIKRQWAALIRNDTLRVDSNGTSVCGLHFLGGRKTYDIRLPSIFPWTPEWTDVVNAYNSKLTDPTCHDDHGYSNESRKPALLTLYVPPDYCHVGPWRLAIAKVDCQYKVATSEQACTLSASMIVQLQFI